MSRLILLALIATLSLADVGKVALVKGDASVERDVKVIKAYNEMGLMKQDVVETAQGRMQMLFNDNTVISLGRESRFVIKEYFYVENSLKVAATFKIEKGFIKTITGLIGKMVPELFVLETSTTKITPHGTIWSVEVDDKSEIYKVLEGRITLSFNDGQERIIELFAGEEALLVKTLNKKVESFKKSKISEKNFKYMTILERDMASLREYQDMNMGSIVDDTGNIVDDGSGVFDDGNNGHGNDPGHFDPSNPGKSKKK